MFSHGIKLDRQSVVHFYVFSFNENILENKDKLIINIQGGPKCISGTWAPYSADKNK